MQTGQREEHRPLLTVTDIFDAILVDMEQSSSTPFTNRLLTAVGELPVNSASLIQIFQARHHWDGRILDEIAPWRAVAEFEVRQCLDRLAEVVADDVKTQIAGLRERPLGAPLYTLLVSSPLAPKKMPRAAIRIIRDHSDVLVSNPYCAARALAGLLAHQQDSSLWASWWPPSDSENSNALKIANALNTIAQGIIKGPPVDLPPLPARYRHGYVPSSLKKSRREMSLQRNAPVGATEVDRSPSTDPSGNDQTTTQAKSVLIQVVRDRGEHKRRWEISFPAKCKDKSTYQPVVVSCGPVRALIEMHDHGKLTSKPGHVNQLTTANKELHSVFVLKGKDPNVPGQYMYELGTIGILLDIEQGVRDEVMAEFARRSNAGKGKSSGQRNRRNMP
jgi:hypothetical protein